MSLYKHRFKLILVLLFIGCHPRSSVRDRNSIQKEYESIQKEYKSTQKRNMKLNSKIDSLMQIIEEYERMQNNAPYPRFTTP